MNIPFSERTTAISEWIESKRPPRNPVDARRPFAFLEEMERSHSGELVSVATIFLTNRECPWRCLHCDLWKNTLMETVPAGSIPTQIDHALAELDRCPNRPSSAPRQIKLYNSGSFFDSRAIPPGDYLAITQRLASFQHVIVESHPALIGDNTRRFQDLLGQISPPKGAPPTLEVAMGLETAHPDVLARLNKGMTLDLFRRASEFLQRNQIALRSFVLVHPPFLQSEEAIRWTQRSVDFSFDCGASVVSLIPTRFGNGALEALANTGEFSPPTVSSIENALEYGVSLGRGRVFADLWDLEKFSRCPACFDARRARLQQINWRQTVLPSVPCPDCDQTL